MSTVAKVTTLWWVLGAVGAAAFAGCLSWIVGGAVWASVRTTASERRDTLLLDQLFDGTQKLVKYHVGAERASRPSAAVLIAGAIDRGYRFVEGNHHGGRTTMKFRRDHRRTTNT